MARSGTGSGNLWKDIYFDSLSSGTLYPKSSSLKTSSLNPQPSTLSSRLHDQCNCRRLLYEDWYTPFGRLLLHISGYTICSLKSTFKQYVYTGRDDHVHCPDSVHTPCNEQPFGQLVSSHDAPCAGATHAHVPLTHG